jgi:hypothetical protein
MIFQQTHGLVLSGRKTQTRRVYNQDTDHMGGKIVGAGANVKFLHELYSKGRLKWGAWCEYAVQPGRGKPAVGRIRITGMSIERLQNITEADARAEGVASIEEFQALWETIHGKKPGERWADNPLVVVIEFVCVEGMQS